MQVLWYILQLMYKKLKQTVILYCFFIFIVSTIFFNPQALKSSPVDITDYEGIPPGARPAGMGNTGIALVNEPFTFFYNPAALSFLRSGFFILDVNRNSASEIKSAFSLPGINEVSVDCISFLNSYGGFSWRPLSRKKITKDIKYFSPEYQTLIDIDSTLEYKTDEFYLSLTSLSSEIMDSLNEKPIFGINLKYYIANLGLATITTSDTTIIDALSNIDSGNGFGLDIGFSYYKTHFLFGISVIDLFSRVYWSDYKTDKIPWKIGTGISLFSKKRWALTTDLRYESGRKTTGLFSGFEYNIILNEKTKIKKKPSLPISRKKKNINIFTLRLGTKLSDVSDINKLRYSFGSRYQISKFYFDIALSGNSNMFKGEGINSQMSILVLY